MQHGNPEIALKVDAASLLCGPGMEVVGSGWKVCVCCSLGSPFSLKEEMQQSSCEG